MGIFSNIGRFFKGGLNAILRSLDPLAQRIADNGGKLLLAAAREAVLAAETTKGTGAEKRDAAKDAIIRTLRRRGIEILVSAAFDAIQVEHAKLEFEGVL